MNTVAVIVLLGVPGSILLEETAGIEWAFVLGHSIMVVFWVFYSRRPNGVPLRATDDGIVFERRG